MLFTWQSTVCLSWLNRVLRQTLKSSEGWRHSSLNDTFNCSQGGVSNIVWIPSKHTKTEAEISYGHWYSRSSSTYSSVHISRRDGFTFICSNSNNYLDIIIHFIISFMRVKVWRWTELFSMCPASLLVPPSPSSLCTHSEAFCCFNIFWSQLLSLTSPLCMSKSTYIHWKL